MSGVLTVNDVIQISRHELVVRATRASGPGGQNVNKVSTRVEIYWNVRESGALDDATRELLLRRLANRLTARGVLRVVASDRRSQFQNRLLAEERLAMLVRRALVIPKKRRATKPTRAAVTARLEDKQRHARKKQERRAPAGD